MKASLALSVWSALTALAAAQTRDLSAPAVGRVVIDGALDEWRASAPSLRLGEAEQVWSAQQNPTAAWRGPDDLSADVWVAHDAEHLYFAGRVRDDSFVAGSLELGWHQQDAVEVFLDLRADRSDPSFESTLQLFVMPFSTERRWGRIQWPCNRPTGAGLIGIRAATERFDGGYTFELAVPVCNFAEFVPGTRDVGFDVAIDDHDEGSDRYQYMTATGRNPARDQTLYCRLRFDGKAPPGAVVGTGGAGVLGWLSANASLVLLPLAGVVFLLALLRGWGALEGARPRVRLAARTGGIALFVAGLVLPGWLASQRQAERERALLEVTDLLRQGIDQMEDGVLGSYGGEQRDVALAALLEGGTITREKRFSFTNLRDVLGPAAAPKWRPELGFAVLPDRIPLRADSVERFTFREPLPPGVLNVAVARPVQSWVADPGAGDRTPPSLLVATAHDDEREPRAQRLWFSGSYFQVPGVVRDGLEVSYRSVTFDRPLRAVTVSAPTGEGLELVGLTWASPDRTAGRPLALGEPSLGGIETDLRGRWPEDAGFELAPGQARVIELPERQDAPPFEKLWLFYRATYLGRPTPTRTGDTVCELRLWDRGATEPRLVDFRHQESMFFGVELQNHDLPASGEVRVAMRWQDEEQEAHVTFVRELDLTAPLARLELRNVGAYPVQFRSLVFGREVSNVAVSTPGSPLERVGATGEERLRPDFRARLGDARIAVYRAGRLTATTLGPARASTHTNMPADVHRGSLAEGVILRSAVDDDAVEHAAFRLLGGDWGGAVLGVFLRDADYRGFVEWVHRIGTLLSLLAAPVLLHMFSQALAAFGNLRVRLIALFAVVMLVPLGTLSVVLVAVLESSHDNDVNARLEQAIGGATQALRQQQDGLRTAAQTWVRDLAKQFTEIAAGPEGANAALRASMERQMPPSWAGAGGFMQFEFNPAPGVSGLPPPCQVFVGPDDLRALSTPLRTEPGLYVAWSVPFIGVRAEAEVPAGACSLSVGRRLDPELLSAIAGDRSVVLCGTNGYPLAVAGGGGLAGGELLQQGLQPDVIEARARAAGAVLDGGRPVIRTHERSGAPQVAAYDVLRDLQETPRALLGLVESYSGAMLPLQVGRVPLRLFFVATAVLLIVASLFLGWVVTKRISEPIERLERGARALSRGELDVHVDADEGGQIGRLTRTFNRMATDLRGRIQDLHVLNRGIRDLTSRLDLAEVLASAVAFYSRHTPADRVRVLLLDRARERVEVHGGEPGTTVDHAAPDVRAVLASGGPHCLRLDGRHGALAALFSDCRSALVLPLVIGGRARGAVLLLFAAARPEEVNLELHATMAVQITAAIENAWLYRHAVEDLHTGTYRPEFFASSVARAIAEAQVRDGAVALLGFDLLDGEELERALGSERHGRLLASLFSVLRRVLGADALLCRAGSGALRAAIEVDERAEVERLLAEAAERLRDPALGVPPRFPVLRIAAACARFPEDAASAEFLFDALAARLHDGETGEGSLGDKLLELPIGGLFVDSPAMRGVFRTLERIAPTDISILIEGETGVGKEVLTNLIHAWSKRASGPLIKVHCAALPEALLQSELFGHEKGAFTGAHERSIGRFEQADGGTIFLDEIGEISLEVQVQLLRVLQEREIERVGGSRPIPVDVRVIAATNRNIGEMVAAGSFREDLYYRLQGMVVVVPPLRERKQEIPLLVEHFRQEAVKSGQCRVEGFAPDAMDELFRRDWPGNIRELRNTVLRALVLAAGPVVTRADLVGGGARTAERAAAEPPPASSPEAQPPPASLSEPTIVVPRPASPPASPVALTGRLAELRAFVAERGTASSTDYAEAAGVSPRTALRDLAELQRLGVVVREGRRRGARYRLADSERRGGSVAN